MSTTISQKKVDLSTMGIHSTQIHYQLSGDELQKISLDKFGGQETSKGVLAVNTGKFTGRSPKDRFIVKDSITENTVWWGDINIPFDTEKFDQLESKLKSYLSDKEVFVRDAYACADERYQLSVRVVNEYPWSNLFADNMFISPSEEELNNFEAEWTVLNAPGFLASPEVDGTRQENFAVLNFSKKTILIGGTAYTGEIKKGIFSALNYILPVQKNVLPMHCSANQGESEDTAIFFGLSGTGKTTLSTDPKRKLVGDDEHGWTPDDVIFNFEGGCYAKVIDLSAEKEPEIYGAIKKGALLENVIINNGEVDYANTYITQNTRVSYPINHIENIKSPSKSENPKNIFFLTCDAFGVLPAISKLSPEQAAYHFISGYTAKVAGTEAGITEPTPSFSACFGAPFMPLHPSKYAEMLSEKIKTSGAKVWMLNTGWVGGSNNMVKRIKLEYTRSLLKAAIDGKLDNVEYRRGTIFKLDMPLTCPGVPSEILSQRDLWADRDLFYSTANKLAEKFKDNFKKFENGCSPEIIQAGPVVSD